MKLNGFEKNDSFTIAKHSHFIDISTEKNGYVFAIKTKIYLQSVLRFE